MLSLATACILFALPCSSCWKFLSPMLSPKIGLKLRICISCFELQLSLWLSICGINEAISEGSGQIIFSYFCLRVSFDSRRYNYCTFYISSKSHRFEEGWVNSYKQQIDTFIFHSETLLFKNHTIVILKRIKKYIILFI